MKPWTLTWGHDRFNLSGHLLLKGVSHGIFVRELAWLFIFRPILSKKLTYLVSISVGIAILYGWYENFCTAIFFHTVWECIVGYILALITIWFPKKNELLNYLNNINLLCISCKQLPLRISDYLYKLKQQKALND